MMRGAVVLFFVAIALAAAAVAQPPIPHGRPGGFDGFIYSGDGNSAIQLDVFYDLICPDSAASWPGIKGVAAQLGPRDLQVRIHSFPLPYHHNGFYAWQGGQFLASRGLSYLWKWLDAFYGSASPNQTNFYNRATQHMSQAEVIAAMGKIANATTDGQVTAAEFEQGLTYDGPFDISTRASWKYSCSLGAYGTPMFRVNGVWFTSAQSTWTTEQWVAALTPLLSPA